MSSAQPSRKWLSLYPKDYLPDLTPEASNPLDHLRKTVHRYGQNSAICYFDKILSYKELDEMSNAFAYGLKDLGIKKDDRVAVYLQNIPQFIIAQYGIWKAGGIVVPLNPMYREKELAYYFRDASVRILISLESLYGDWLRRVVEETRVEQVITTSELDFLDPSSSLPSLLKGVEKIKGLGTLDFMELLERNRGKCPPEVQPSSGEVAYLTYTSGTTGPPKGAMNTHGNVAFNSEVYRHCWKLKPSDILLGVAPFFHVTGMVGHIGAAVASGARLVLFYRFDTKTALQMIERWKVTSTIGAITVFIALMNDPEIGKYDLSSFRKVYSGGAPVIPAVVERFEKLTGTYIHNVYGLTESTSPATLVPLGSRAPVDPSTGAIAIGVPIPGHDAKIMDLSDPEKELAPGEVGELAIKGPGIIPGYWNKPEETAHAIRQGWLFTGDVGTMDDKGWVYLLDRKKDMIIASGFKVWPREVEDVIYLHPSVREVAVVGIPDPYRGETVKAFVALKEGFEGKVTGEEIIHLCKEKMAAYKYPRQVEFVKEVPKTATGKFLRRALRKPQS
ncbi:MAG: acyl-CoA synthetase [Deltaproteobacteria bacterium RBG_16_50_11]|nr:MAG: acyl-CoA synthetase [Deltaproteobacteria bacterium RBG_16_50_11]